MASLDNEIDPICFAISFPKAELAIPLAAASSNDSPVVCLHVAILKLNFKDASTDFTLTENDILWLYMFRNWTVSFVNVPKRYVLNPHACFQVEENRGKVY